METCIVGCKLPHGLQIELPGQPKPIKLNGNNSARIIGGYGITPGIPKEAMEKWIADHKDLAYVRNGSVFVERSEKDARAYARERVAERTGFEAMDPAARQLSPEDAKVLAKQRAENPDRNRQVDELNA